MKNLLNAPFSFNGPLKGLIKRNLDILERRALESSPENSNIDEIRSLLKAEGLPDTEADAKRVLKFRLSTDHVDRYGTVFSLRGWQTAEYRKNPVFLYQHNNECMSDSVQMPVGRSIKEWTVLPQYQAEMNTRADDPKKAKLDYPAHIRTSPLIEGKDDGTGLFQLVYFPQVKNSEAVLRAYNTKLLNAVSVGAKPDVIVEPSDVPEEVRTKVGFKRGWFLNTRLIEGSAVTLPGNPNAIKMALDQGYPKEFLTILGLDSLEERFGPIRSAVKSILDVGPKLLTEQEAQRKIISELSICQLQLSSELKVIRGLLETLANKESVKPTQKPVEPAEDSVMAKLQDKIGSLTSRFK